MGVGMRKITPSVGVQDPMGPQNTKNTLSHQGVHLVMGTIEGKEAIGLIGKQKMLANKMTRMTEGTDLTDDNDKGFSRPSLFFFQDTEVHLSTICNI